MRTRRRTAAQGHAPRRTLAAVAVLLLAGALPSIATADPLPAPWLHVPLNASKPRTHYGIGTLQGWPAAAGVADVLSARSDGAASMAIQAASVDLAIAPFVTWRWLIRTQPDAPDIATGAREDAAARVIFFFDGDRKRLPLTDRVVMAAADRLGSRPMPYATLMYVSAPGRAVDEILPNPYTRRIRMVVVDPSDPAGPQAWREFRRNLRDDYRRAFGEEPGPLLGWGVMTDSDNTRSRAEAIYAAFRFLPAP